MKRAFGTLSAKNALRFMRANNCKAFARVLHIGESNASFFIENYL